MIEITKENTAHPGHAASTGKICRLFTICQVAARVKNFTWIMHMNSPLVSIIIPTYNRAYVLAETLDSVLDQTYQNYEALIIDDGSKDDTEELVKKYTLRDPRFKYIKQENAGVSSARNNGMRQSKGELLAFLDSDDLWFPWKLQLQVELMNKLPECIMLWSDMQSIGETGEFLAPRHLRTMYGSYKGKSETYPFSEHKMLKDYISEFPLNVSGEIRVSTGNIFLEMLYGNLVHTSTVIFRRKRFVEAELFLEKYRHAGEDYHFHLMTCKLGSVAYMDISTIKYRLGLPDRITHPKNKLIFAQAYLETVKPFLDTPIVPESQKREIMASSHQWIGEQLLDNNLRMKALSHFFANLSDSRYRGEAAKMILKTLLPMSLIRKFTRKKTSSSPHSL